MTDDVREALTMKLNEEIANDVLIKIPKDTTPQNIISIFAVGKLNEIGDMVLNAHSCRIVLDCSRTANQMSHFKATQADGISQIINKAARFTKRGLIGTKDIQSMFNCFKLDRKLWPFFCVEHPDMGLFCYKRCQMGWAVSPQSVREFMLRILYKFKDNLCRYLDDIIF